jgi:hypothetical protein
VPVQVLLSLQVPHLPLPLSRQVSQHSPPYLCPTCMPVRCQ